MKLRQISDWKIASITFLVITILFCYPLLTVLQNIGTHDWDQHLLYEGSARESILTYYQFPLWSPWQCGGNMLLANPQSSFLSLHFPLTLLFGEVVGTKLAIPLYLFVGMLGMWFVCRKLEMRILSSYFPPLLLMLSGVYAVRMSVGHTNWFHLAWIPWIFFFFLKAKENWLFIFPCSFFLALIFLGGGIHPFVIAIVIIAVFAFFTTLKHWKQQKGKFFFLLILLLVLWIPFAAVKLFPMLAVADEMLPIEQTDMQPNTALLLFEALTARETNFGAKAYEAIDPVTGETVQWYWHEYFAYIGVVPLLLFFVAFFFLFAAYWEYLFSALFILFLILSQQFFPLLWKVVSLLPFSSLFHGPSRFLFAFIFFLALTLGFLLSYFEKKEFQKPQESQKSRESKESYIWQFVLLCILFFVLVDLTLVNSPLFLKAFSLSSPLSPPEIVEENATFFSTLYGDREGDEDQQQQYSLFLSNHGLLNCYERFRVASAVSPSGSSSGIVYGDYTGEVFLNATREKQEIIFWSPNKIEVAVSVIVSDAVSNATANAASDTAPNASDVLVLNQNHISGWRAIVDGDSRKIMNINGLVGVNVTSRDKVVVFYYLPSSFVFGLIITIVSLLSLIALFLLVPSVRYFFTNKH